eukprot:COSAG01_NODE_55604_length_324_cov_0.506667_1_plen_78_part_00
MSPGGGDDERPRFPRNAAGHEDGVRPDGSMYVLHPRYGAYMTCMYFVHQQRVSDTMIDPVCTVRMQELELRAAVDSS